MVILLHKRNRVHAGVDGTNNLTGGDMMSGNGYSLEDREAAYRMVKTIKEEFEISKALAGKYDSARSVCNRMLSKLKNESHQHLYDLFKEDLMRCGLIDENGSWRLLNDEGPQK